MTQQPRSAKPGSSKPRPTPTGTPPVQPPGDILLPPEAPPPPHAPWMKFIATGFGIGYIPLAPGTFGTLAAVGIYFLVCNFSLAAYAVGTVVFLLLAIHIAGRAESLFGVRDPQQIVIDEWAGYFIAMMPGIIPGWDWTNVIVGFLLFRIFDIAKPFPARGIQQMDNGGMAICLDDTIAGLYAWLTRVLLFYLAGYVPNEGKMGVDDSFEFLHQGALELLHALSRLA